jgi:3-oxoacyl-[acyl-carrier-protein] synthase-3
MEGREVLASLVGMITGRIVDAFKATGATAEDIDWFVPHQANKRISSTLPRTNFILPRKRWC